MESLSEKSSKRPLLLRLISAVLLLLVCGLLYLGTVLFQRDSDQEAPERIPEAAPVLENITPGEYSDISLLRQAAGYPLLAFSEPFLAQTENLNWMGRTVHRVVMRFSSGMEILSVSPAEAAPLIRQEGMNLAETEDLMVLQMHAALAVGDAGACLYFSSGQAAYCLFGPGMTGEEIIRASRSLTQDNVH